MVITASALCFTDARAHTFNDQAMAPSTHRSGARASASAAGSGAWALKSASFRSRYPGIAPLAICAGSVIDYVCVCVLAHT